MGFANMEWEGYMWSLRPVTLTCPTVIDGSRPGREAGVFEQKFFPPHHPVQIIIRISVPRLCDPSYLPVESHGLTLLPSSCHRHLTILNGLHSSHKERQAPKQVGSKEIADVGRNG